MPALVTLYSGSSGLNTKLEPRSLSQGGKDTPGVIELAEAVNVSIDDRGLCTVRNGNILLIPGAFASLYCAGGDCFAVEERESDAAIVQINNDLSSILTIRTGLSKGYLMSWGMSGYDTFYSNGVENGYIRDSVNYSWPVHEYLGAEADLQFAASIPKAKHIGFQQGGKVLIAVGNGVFVNHSPFQYGLFELGHGNVAAFESGVIMLAPVGGGFYASDNRRTWFFRQLDTWYHYRQELVEDAPAIEWSLAHDRVNLREIGIDMQGFGSIWASQNGLCLGTDDGVFINLTKEKVKYPSGYAFGACLLKDYTVIHTAW